MAYFCNLMEKLSIVIPAYNEARTIHHILDKVLAVNLIADMTKELVIVNDGSKDETAAVVKANIRVFVRRYVGI